jgi:hypothetical protein
VNREFLKEAIADAKAVKESAIANAKSALEEALTPQLKSMLSEKINEMDKDEDEKETMEEYGKMKSYDEDDKVEEMSKYYEDDEEEEIETDSEEEVEVEETDEDVELEDMSEEDLKKFIEDVIEDMVKAGELEAGESFEDDVEVEVDDEGEIEIVDDEETAVDENINETTEVEEAKEMTDPVMRKDMEGDDEAEIETEKMRKMEEGEIDEALSGGALELLKMMKEIGVEVTLDQAKMLLASAGLTVPAAIAIITAMGKAAAKFFKKLIAKPNMEEDLSEAYSTIETLKGELNEINLLNAKLLYTNKIFKSKNLTESQKLDVLNTFDKAETVKEVKLVFESLNASMSKVSKKSIKENLGSASKVISGNAKTEKVVEVDPMIERFQKLAGIL